MDSRLTRWINGILEAGWLIALIIAPLFFNVQSDRVFEPDKIALLRSIALVMAAAWLVRFIDRRGWQNLGHLDPRDPDSHWRKPLVVVIGLLVLIYILSTIFSVNPRVSLFGSYQRLQGTYSTFSYIVIFAMMASTIKSREQIQRIVTVIIITSIPVAFYGVLQRFELDPLPWGGNVSDRVAGHLGNAIFIAAYLIMVVPLTLARILDAFSNILGDERLAISDVIRSSIYIFTLALQLIAIYWSGSRGPLLGLLVGLFAFMLVLLVSLRNAALGETAARRAAQVRDLLPALLFLLPALLALLFSNAVSTATSPMTAFLVYMGTVGVSVLVLFVMVAAGQGWRWLWLGWMLLALFVGGWLISFNLAPASAAELPIVGNVVTVQEQWRDLPTIGSFGKMLDSTSTGGREKSGRVRVLIWEGVVNLIAPHDPLVFPDGRQDPYNFLRPLLGYGPESMYVVYNRFYPPELATVEARNASPDRSHNETFDALVITGWLGYLVWQTVYLSVLFVAFRYLGVVGSRRDGLVLIGLMAGGGLVALLLAQFVFGGIYLGVAVPVGIIGGIILYLVYYALAGQRQAPQEGAAANPFYIDRLIMNALVAAVLAHYVEIHFGIAIGSTRLLFFTFAALMLALSTQRAAQDQPEAEPAAPAAEPQAKPERRRRRTVSASVAPTGGPNIWPRLLAVAILLTFIVGLIGITFITYSLPPDKEISSAADLGIIEIFRQSLLQHAKENFRASPYIYMMIIMTWALGWLIFLSEMIKEGQLDAWKSSDGQINANRKRLAGAILAVMAIAGIAARFFPSLGGLTVSPLAQSLALGWGVLSAVGAAWLLLDRPGAQLLAGAIALVGLSISPALLIAGATAPSLILAALCLAVLLLAWDKTWRFTLGRLLPLTTGSVLAGLVTVLLYTARYKEALFFRPATRKRSSFGPRRRWVLCPNCDRWRLSRPAGYCRSSTCSYSSSSSCSLSR